MKFGKEFASQMELEWEEEYMDYEEMKSVLMELYNHKKKRSENPIRLRPPAARQEGAAAGGAADQDNIVQEHIPVITVTMWKDGEDELVEIEFQFKHEDGGEYETTFFKRLDDELNKVLRFYRKKVKEVMTEAAALNEQMNEATAAALNAEVNNPSGRRCHTPEDKVKKAEATLQRRFVKLYHKLNLIKDYWYV